MAIKVEDQINNNIAELTERIRETERTLAKVDRHIIKSKILDSLYELKEVEGSPEYKKGYYTAIMKAYEVVIKEFKNFEEIANLIAVYERGRRDAQKVTVDMLKRWRNS